MRPKDPHAATGGGQQLSLFDLPDLAAVADDPGKGSGEASAGAGAWALEVIAEPSAGSFTPPDGESPPPLLVEPWGEPMVGAAATAASPYAPGLARTPATSVLPRAAALRGAVDEYKQYLAAMNRSRHTQASFGLDLKLLMEHLGDPPLTVIGERDLRSFISWVRTERHNTPTSVRRKVASLKNFFSYLHRERLIASDPAQRLIYPDIYPALPEFLEDEQAADLLVVTEDHRFWKALISLMLATGLKRDEVVALGRADVQLTPQGGYLVVRETEQAKRLRSRRLELDADVSAVLQQYLRDEPERERFFDVSIRGVNFIIETCGKRAGITVHGNKLTPQVLRETFAVRQMRRLVAQEDTMRRAGRGEEALVPVREAHDVQLLRLLGLHEEPESARKYRKLVRGWAADTAP